MGDRDNFGFSDVAAFCERCGGRLGTAGRAREATQCRVCEAFVCSSCRVTSTACRWCVPVTPARGNRTAGLTQRFGIAGAGIAALVAILAVAVLAPRGESSTSSAAASQTAAERTSSAATGAGSRAGAVSPSNGATNPPTPSPSTAAVDARASVRVMAESARTWSTEVGGTSLEVVVAVRNGGNAPLQLDASRSTYVVRDSTGATAVSGRFAMALPPTLPPEATAYLVATDTTPLLRASSRLEVEPHVAVSPASRAADELEIRVSRPTYSSGSVRVPATLVNHSDTTVTNVMIGAVLLDEDDRPLAALYQFADAGPLGPRSTARVTVDYPPSGPVIPGRVARVAACAFALDP